MMSTAKVYLKEFAILDKSSRNTNDHTSNPANLDNGDFLLLLFEDLPASMQFKRFVGSQILTVYVSKLVDRDDPSSPYCKLLRKENTYARTFDVGSATYNNCDFITSDQYIEFGPKVESTGSLSFDDYGVFGFAVNEGVVLKQSSIDATVSITTSGARRPYLTVEVDDSDTLGCTVSECAPASGTIQRTAPVTFTWKVSGSTAYCSPAVVAASTVFQWREGASGTIHDVPVSGSAKSITIPTGTFPAANLQWRVCVTANSGVTTNSDWMSVSTFDATPSAKVVSPENTFVDATIDNTFIWAHIIETGTSQTKADLQASENGLTWSALTSVTGAATQWVCPAGTLSSSVKYWRVRTYNADSVASDWSDAAQIVVVSAPPTPVVNVRSTGPRPEISWQTTGQQAAQIVIDGVYESGTVYGRSQQWVCPIYLDDGDYTVKVRAQNEYGLWSEWGTAALPIVNVPGAAIHLRVVATHKAELFWETTGSYDYYLIYRNDVPIARTAATTYTDALSIGQTHYFVRGCYTGNSNYGVSGTVDARITPETFFVSDLDTGKTIMLHYAASPTRQTSRVSTRVVSYIVLSGTTYPVAEASENYTDVLTVVAASADADTCRELDDLLGRVVCVKTPSEDMAIGYLDTLTKENDGFLTNYTITVQRIDYNEEVQL